MSASLKLLYLPGVVRTLLLSVLLIGLPAAADVYTYIDAQGHRVFTDRPQGGADRVHVPPSNSASSVAPKPAPAAPLANPLFHYRSVQIGVPAADAAVRSTPGELVISVSNDPALQSGHSYRLLLDGQPVRDAGEGPIFTLSNIDRGTHQLVVEILDASGRTLDSTPNRTFHMLRISLAQKRLARPCMPDDFGVRPECPLADKPPEKHRLLPFF